jgi:hypothetical protein
MTRIRLAGLCLVAVLAISAVATAASASAMGNPEYVVCVKAKGGHFSDKACSVAAPEGKGKYELAPISSAKKKALKGKSGASKFTLYIPEKGRAGEINCEKKNVKVGETTSSGTTTYHLTLGGCTGSGLPCTSTGSKAGTIETGTVSGRLVLVSGSPLKVGILIGEPGATLVEFNCGGVLNVKITGSVIGEITGNINVVSKAYTYSFAVNAGGENLIQAAEGGPANVLSATLSGIQEGTYPVGFSSIVSVKGEALEIRDN